MYAQAMEKGNHVRKIPSQVPIQFHWVFLGMQHSQAVRQRHRLAMTDTHTQNKAVLSVKSAAVKLARVGISNWSIGNHQTLVAFRLVMFLGITLAQLLGIVL